MTWSIASYSTTAASNTAINGTNIAPGCDSASVGPFMRQIMADIATALSNGQFMPTGAVLSFSKSTAPTGYLACDGSAVSRTTYATLFALIGSTFGSGDGSTTFNLPDLRGRVPVGYDASNTSTRMTGDATGGIDASAIGNTGGEQAHVQTTAELVTHTHTLTDGGHTHTATTTTNPSTVITSGGLNNVYAGPGSAGTSSGFTATTTVASATTGITVDDEGSSDAANVVQPGIVLLWCIKT